MTETTLLQIITDFGVSGVLLYGMWHILRRNDELHREFNDRSLKMTNDFRSDMERKRNSHETIIREVTEQFRNFTIICRDDLEKERLSHETHMRELADQFKQFTDEVTNSMALLGNELRLMRSDLDEIKANSRTANSIK